MTLLSSRSDPVSNYQQHSTAAAVVAGAVLIAGVHHYDNVMLLRRASNPEQQPPVVMTSPAPALATGGDVPSRLPAVTAGVAAPPTASGLRERAQTELSKQVPDYVSACWHPSGKRRAPGFFQLTVEFDGTGKERGRTVRHATGPLPLKDDVLLACVQRAKVPALEIEGSGTPLAFELSLTMP